MIQTQDERNAAEIVRCIRSGHAVDAIVHCANTGVAFASLDPERHALDTLLINLVHSTGSLRQILGLGMSVSTGFSRLEVPDPQCFRLLCNRIVHFSYMENMLRTSKRLSPVFDMLSNEIEQLPSADTHYTTTMQDEYPLNDSDSFDVPPHQVPAAPWTTLTSDDDAVSHLISLFLAWINPGWRFVEGDLFLKGIPKLCTYRPFIKTLQLVACTRLTLSR